MRAHLLREVPRGREDDDDGAAAAARLAARPSPRCRSDRAAHDDLARVRAVDADEAVAGGVAEGLRAAAKVDEALAVLEAHGGVERAEGLLGEAEGRAERPAVLGKGQLDAARL